MGQLLAIGLGGFVGAILRYSISSFVQGRIAGSFPAGTLAVNVLGSFALGLLVALLQSRADFPEPWRLFLTVGVLGALTTFSTFGYEVVALVQEGRVGLAAAAVAANLALGLAAVCAGLACAGGLR
ncbi:MAG: fluoride efflux transporter CrcB [Planctomycetota bacterium]